MSWTDGYSHLDVQWADGVVVCTLNRPEALNALSSPMMDELEDFWGNLDQDARARVGVVTGAGQRAFCTGADVASDTIASASADYAVANRWSPLYQRISKPTICAVNGICAGGGLHFVGGMSFAIAAEGATFMDPHTSVGLVSGCEPIGLLGRIPRGDLLRMLCMGAHERITAANALRMGLVSEVVPSERLVGRATELAAAMSRNSPSALRKTLMAVEFAATHDREAGLSYAWDLIQEQMSHPDAAEGPAAFRARRPASWTSG